MLLDNGIAVSNISKVKSSTSLEAWTMSAEEQIEIEVTDSASVDEAFAFASCELWEPEVKPIAPFERSDGL